ncbi:MAG: copper homeostasis protein CutC, partial [Cryomorphaceae bacterium]
MTLEICTEDLAQSLAAQACGAHRIELCADLHNGGTTPSHGMMEQVSEACNIPVFAMIRPRGGDFCYSAAELRLMLSDIRGAARANVAGVVFGVLNNDSTLNLEHNQMLLNEARQIGLAATFHRAIDVCRDPLHALETLMEMGFQNVLTSGQETTAEKGLALIAAMTQLAGDTLTVMAGSGVNPTNAEIFKRSGIKALHVTARKEMQSSLHLHMGTQWKPDEEKIRGILKAVR